MSITAFTSAAANPQSAQVDLEIDLSGDGELPVALVPLYGAAIDSEDESPSWSWSWSILRQPPGGSVAWASGADDVQNPTLTNVTLWGNVRVFLVATNLNTGETSETDPNKAPTCAFVHVRVLSPRKGLEKPAPGEREWHARVWELIQVVEDLETPTDAQPVLLTATTAGTMTSRGYRPGVTCTPTYDDPDPEAVCTVPFLHVFWCPVAMSFTAWSISLQDGGSATPGTAYAFKLYTGTKANYLAGEMSQVVAMNVTGAPATDRAPLVLEKTLGEGVVLSVPAGGYLAVKCTAAPSLAAGKKVGGPAHVTIYGRRA